MKVKRQEVVPVFEPIILTIESVDELKWLIAIANSSAETASELAYSLGFKIEDNCRGQMSLWDCVGKYLDDVR